MRKFIVFLTVFIMTLSLFAVNSYAATITGLTATINQSTKDVSISGTISTGADKQVTLKVTYPVTLEEYISQMTSGVGGSFQFDLNLGTDAPQGTYEVDVSGENVTTTAETTFDYDITPPADPTISPSTTDPTNSDVTITISYSGDSQVKQYKVGGGTYTDYTAPFAVSSNTTVYAKARDACGNWSSEVSTVINNIDKTPPADPTFSQTPTIPTNSSVTLTISYSLDSAQKQYKLEGGAYQDYTGTIDITDNTTVYAKACDAVGNWSNEVTHNITNIDKVSPSDPTFAADTTDPTNGNVTVTISYPGDAHDKLYKVGADGTFLDYTAPVVVTDNTTVYAKCADEAGNSSGTSSIAISNIDRVAPATPTINETPTTATNSDVSVEVTYSLDSTVRQYKIGAGAYTAYTGAFAVANNATVYAKSRDAAGNWSEEASLNITNIDKTPPTNPILSIDPTTPVNTQVTLTIGYSVDSAQKQYKIGAGGVYQDYTDPVVITDNCTVYAKACDDLGNWTGEISLAITNIDKTAPSAPTFSADPTIVTAGDVTVTITYPGDAAIRQYKIGADGTYADYTAPIVITANTTVYAKCRDNATNWSSESNIAISNIDKTAPSSNVGYPSQGTITVTSAQVQMNIDENGRGYCVCLENGAAAPTSAQVKDGTDSLGSAMANNLKANVALTEDTTGTATFTTLEPNTSYDVYIVYEDSLGNLQATPTKLTVRTNPKFNISTSFRVGTNLSPVALAAGKGFEATAVTTNNQTISQDALLIVALYRQNGSMETWLYGSKNVGAGLTENINAGFLLPANVTGYTVKAFVWSGTSIRTSTMEPLSEVRRLP